MLVMEFVNGLSLAEYVERKGPLSVSHACHFIQQAALGLQHAHEKGMVHRDLKPHNLILTPKGVVKILDFGLARIVSEAGQAAGLTQENALMGTPDFIPPEQATDARNADIRSDIYSLGCTLYYLLTGQPPFPEGTAIQKVLAHLERKPKSIRDFRKEVPAELVAVLDRMLAKDPAKRYQTPAQVAEALAPFVKPAARAKENTAAATPPTAERKGAAAIPLLKHAAKAFVKVAGNAVGFGVGGDLLVIVAEEIWKGWSSQKDEGQRKAELAALALVSSSQIAAQAEQIIDEVADGQRSEVREAARSYLTQLPDMVRKSLQRPADPTGTTLPKNFSLSKAEDLRPFVTLLPDAGSVLPLRTQTKPKKPPLNRRVLIAAGAGAISALILLAVVIVRLSGPGGEGVLTIETVDADVEVIVRQGGKEVAVLNKKTHEEVKLPIGAYEVELAGNKKGLTLTTRHYTLKSGDREVVRVTWEPRSTEQNSDVVNPAKAKETSSPPQKKATLGELQHRIAENGLASVTVDNADLLPLKEGTKHPVAGQPWTIMGVPAWLSGKKFSSNRGSYSGVADFTVDKAGMVLMAVGPQTPPASREQLHQEGWAEVDAISTSNGKCTVYWRDCKKGETFHVKTQLHFAPVIILDDASANSQSGLDKSPTSKRIDVGNIDILEVAFLPDNQRALVHAENKLLLLDLSPVAVVRPLRFHSFAKMTISADGKSFLTTGFDGAARLCDVGTGDELMRYEGHQADVQSIAISADGRWVVTGSGKVIRVFDAGSGKLIANHNQLDNPVLHVTITADGQYVYSSVGRQICRLERSSGRIEKLLDEVNGTRLIFSADGSKALVNEVGEGIMRLWDLPNSRERARLFGFPAPTGPFAWSEDARLVVTGNPPEVKLLVWDLVTCKLVGHLAGSTLSPNGVAVSSDGRLVLSFAGQELRLWVLTNSIKKQEKSP